MRLVSVRYKGGSSKYEQAQWAAMEEQQRIDAERAAIDQEYYDMRRANRALYDEQFRPIEEDLLVRAGLPARESTSAAARASTYDASLASSREASERRGARYGIESAARPDTGDDVIRAIALTAVGNTSKQSALETQGMIQQAGIGIGTDVNRDIATTFGRSLEGMNAGLGHADAAFANYSGAQQHLNNAYLAEQQGYGALIGSAASVAGMGLQNYYTAQRTAALQDGGEVGFKSAFTGSPLT
jgi:hypothetical protein